MIKIDEGKFNAKGDYFKLTTEFEVLCRCFREMLVERLGEDDANAKFDELIANSKMAEEERLKLVKENFSAGLDNLFKELAKKLSEEDGKVESEPKQEEKLAPEFKPEETTGKSAFANFLNDFLKF